MRGRNRSTTSATRGSTLRRASRAPGKVSSPRGLQIISEFARAVTGALTLPAVLEIGVTQSVRALDCDAAAILLWSDETQEFRFGQARGFPSQSVQGAPVDIKAFTQQLEQAGLVSWLSVVLRGQGQFKGLLFLGRRHQTPARPRERELAEALGTLLGLGLHNAQLSAEDQLRTEQLLQAEKFAALGRLLTGIMHEINNPLAAIQGFNELLLLHAHTPPVREYVAKMQGEVQRIAHIVSCLHSSSFVRAERRQKLVVNLHELIEHVLTLRAYSFKTNNLRVLRQFTAELPCVLANPAQLEQVLLKLLNDAEQVTLECHGKGVLTVRTQSIYKAGVAFVRLAVLAAGPGIPEEIRERTLEPVFTRKLTGQASGLGLSTCRCIISEHGGHIYVKVGPSGGTAFVVELPAIQKQVRDEVCRVASHAPAPASPPVRILVVEDEQVVGEVLGELLSEAGHSVELALGVKSAVSKLGQEVYDVIIADIKMPQLSGIDLYHLLQKTNPALSERVIFSTGDTLSEATRRFLEETGHPYVLKPFQREQLFAQIQALLAQPEQSAA